MFGLGLFWMLGCCLNFGWFCLLFVWVVDFYGFCGDCGCVCFSVWRVLITVLFGLACIFVVCFGFSVF